MEEEENNIISGPSNDEVLKPFGLPKFIEIKGEKLLTTDFLLDTYGYKPYLPGDDRVELDKFVTKKDVETLQDQLKAAGYLKDGSLNIDWVEKMISGISFLE